MKKPSPIIRFDAYEISPVFEIPNEDPSKPSHLVSVDLDRLTKTERRRVIWTLYGHIQGQGASQVGDMDTWDHCAAVYEGITGVRVPKKYRNQRLHGLETYPGGPRWGGGLGCKK